MAVTRQDVVGAAIAVLDEAGLEGVTLRAVAARLGVRAPTLYWHVRDKGELLDLVAAGIMAGARLPAAPAHGQSWWGWLADRARAQYDAMLAHRDGARVVAGNRPTEETWPDVEATLGQLAAAGVPPMEGLQILFVVGAYVIGSALERESERARLAVPLGDGEVPWRDPERYPHVAAAMRAVIDGPQGTRVLDGDQVFDHGLRRLLDGLRSDQDLRRAAEDAISRAVGSPSPDVARIPGAGPPDAERIPGAGPPDAERIPGAGPPDIERIGRTGPGQVPGGSHR